MDSIKNVIYPRFELVTGYTDTNLIPQRATAGSAGYDFAVAEDTLVPSYHSLLSTMQSLTEPVLTLNDISTFTKQNKCKPTLVPTGVKAYIPNGQFLQISVRSSCPLKNWLILANGVGIIDADYYNNPDNEGHIYFQIINLFPRDILLKQGDKIGQGIFINYFTTLGDNNTRLRSGGFGSTSK